MLGLLGICLLAIACINFINLSTARAQRRAKEVAVRKVTGAFRATLIVQFLCEAILMAASAGVISLVLVYLILPFFSVLIGHQLLLNLSNSMLWLSAAAIILGIGFLAGSYPALYISAFKPVKILKVIGVSSHRSILRNLLVVFNSAVRLHSWYRLLLFVSRLLTCKIGMQDIQEIISYIFLLPGRCLKTLKHLRMNLHKAVPPLLLRK
ncbi:MAG: hypothetical protein IPK96_01405 [Flammeovirgaceae bacterium]|nr:hypothetical protein [Flammeovirgaceae bacterium]